MEASVGDCRLTVRLVHGQLLADCCRVVLMIQEELDAVANELAQTARFDGNRT